MVTISFTLVFDWPKRFIVERKEVDGNNHLSHLSDTIYSQNLKLL